jgi:serine protease Do
MLRTAQHVMAALAFAVSLVSGSCNVAAEDALQLPDTVDRVSASVVSVAVETTAPTISASDAQSPRPDTTSPRIVRGSGMVLTTEGHIITAAPVVNAANKVTVVFRDGSQTVAQIAGKDALTGVAVLKVNPPSPLIPVHFANSDRVRAGQPVFSVGNPFGLRGTVSSGIISAVARDATAPYQVLQTDVPIHPGSPGAPLFNFNGEVVGMASTIFTQAGRPTGIGFAVPSNVLKDVADRLQRVGVFERGFLGLQLRKPSEQEATSLGLQHGEGVIIVHVVEGGPTANSGLIAGDAIATLNGRPIGDLAAFVRSVFDLPPKSEVTLEVIKKSGRATVRVTLGRLGELQSAASPAPAPEKASNGTLGCSKYIPSAGITVSAPCDE